MAERSRTKRTSGAGQQDGASHSALSSKTGWTEVGRGWQAKHSELQLMGWSRKRHVVVMRRSTPKDVALTAQTEEGDQMLLGLLDVTFRQDDCRIRKANATANFATINHAAMNLLRQVPGKKMSLPRKRRSAAWDDDYMEAIIRQ